MSCYEDGGAALIANGRHSYLGFWPDVELLGTLIAKLARQAGLKTVLLPGHVRLRRRGDLVFAFNYGPKVWDLPAKAKPLLGTKKLAPHSVAIWKA